MTLSQRLFLVAAVAILPTVIILVLNLFTLRQNAENDMREEALSMAHIAVLELRRITSGVESTLRAVASAPIISEGRADECNDYLAKLIVNLPSLVGLAIADAEGGILCSSLPSTVAVNIADRPYFQQALQDPSVTVIGTLVTGRTSGNPSLPMALALEPGSTWGGGAIIAGLDLTWLGERVKERDFAGGSALLVADRSGMILAREPFPEEFVGTRVADRFLHLVYADGPGTELLLSRDGTERMVGYFPVSPESNYFYVLAGLSTEKGYAAATRITIAGVLVGIVGILFALVMARFTSDYFIRRPFNRLVSTVDAWQNNDFDVRTSMGDDLAEFGRAGRAMDQFMDQFLDARRDRREAERQRELLVRELDHRVKNIVSTVQAMARQTFRGKGHDDLVRAFTDRLRSMGTAHNLLLNDHWQTAPIKTLISATIKPFEDAATHRFILSGGDINIVAKATMSFAMALHELCTNAAKYGALSVPTGKVHISWNVTTEQGERIFNLSWVERDGPPVHEPAGRGFGSAMIEQVLAQQLGGTVSIEFHPDGLVCRVQAPLLNMSDEGLDGSVEEQPSFPPPVTPVPAA